MGSVSLSGRSFTAPPEVHSFAAILFDFDGNSNPILVMVFAGYAYAWPGTIIDSTDAIVKHWHK